MIKKKHNEEKNNINFVKNVDNVFKSKNINLNTPVSGFSLSSIELKKAARSANKPKEKRIDKPKDYFKFSALESLWEEYISNLKKEGKQNIASILSVNNITFHDTNKIYYTVPSEMNKIEMIREMDNLIPFLRKRLNNYSVEIELLVSESAKEESIYSEPEKYQYLKKINPVLEELKERFDLNF